ncbi:MAG: Thymidylate kinase [Watsoniomyces obsoletus]|nr:MAG: Thymidylate kinase [Watsoniomyces obsoletus]
MADYVTHQHSSTGRISKMGDRTLVWTRQMIEACVSLSAEDNNSTSEGDQPALFAPILPIPLEEQSYYLDELLEEDLLRHVSGLAIHDASLLPSLPEQFQDLPRLSLDDAIRTPHDVLYQISLGIDLFSPTFIGAATDGGIALDFSFPQPASLSGHVVERADNGFQDQTSNKTDMIQDQGQPPHNEINALGIDMWSPHHATDLNPLRPNCECYTCRRHHRAFVHHLLITSEMLGWVLLQIHNLHVIDLFFAGIRTSIANGEFDRDRHVFERVYQSDFPPQTGQGPRIRGYQFKSIGKGEPKANPLAYRSLDNDDDAGTPHQMAEDNRGNSLEEEVGIVDDMFGNSVQK